ncbi:hypothetical protein GC170_20500 [bacterium]|nr:hypothetical protein [bacterium]
MNARPESPAASAFVEAAKSNHGPEANALKHGHCATKIVDEELRLRAEEIHDQLRRIHDPWSQEESEAVEDLAQNLARLERLETAMDALVKGEKARAGELYDRRALDAFTADLARFRSEPSTHLHILGQSWLGADWLEKLWGRVESALKPVANTPENEPARTSLSFRLACEAANALGGRWQVDQVEGDAAWFLARYVRISPVPEESLEAWIQASNTLDGPKTTLALANRIVAQAPLDPVQALAELVTKSACERSRWALQANRLRSNYETEAGSAADQAVGTGVGDPGLEKQFRLLTRYLTSARNRVDRLRRRLDAMKKDRKTFAWRSQQAAEREARRLKRESDAARKRCDAELARADDQPSDWPARHGYPVYEDATRISREREYSWCGPVGDAVDPSIASIASRPAEFTDLNPGASDNFEESTQVDENSEYAIELRNGFTAGTTADSSVDLPSDIDADEDEAEDSADSKSAAERQALLALPRDGSTFKDRFKRLRYRNWSDPAEVMPDEAGMLGQIMALPESFERAFTIKALFGSTETFQRCWKRYSKWADPKLVESAQSAYRASLK